MRTYRKQDFPVGDVRRFLEPGPIVLVSSAWKGAANIMTMGWHMILGEEPSLVGCYVWSENHSRHMIAGSKRVRDQRADGRPRRRRLSASATRRGGTSTSSPSSA